jgi:hypothetical protein
VAAVFATYLMMKWPKVEEPVNPMAKYRNEVIDDD